MDWQLPGYTELRPLGTGATGRVLMARHEATGTSVAIKYLSDALFGDDEFRSRFRGEAELLAGVSGEHVARLYEYVEGPDGAAIVMELVQGVSLRELIRRAGPTGPEAALAVLKGSLLGLGAAHAWGVVHQDYKPGNVLVDTNGQSKLVDFGIAVRSGVASQPSGTPHYMAPEQWSDAPVTPATDVYAATATFVECLTGKPPYPVDDVRQLALRHRNAPVPVEGVPEPLRELVRRGMAKDPTDRPPDAAGFVSALEDAASAAYGKDWERRGHQQLAGRVAALPCCCRTGRPPPRFDSPPQRRT